MAANEVGQQTGGATHPGLYRKHAIIATRLLTGLHIGENTAHTPAGFLSVSKIRVVTEVMNTPSTARKFRNSYKAIWPYQASLVATTPCQLQLCNVRKLRWQVTWLQPYTVDGSEGIRWTCGR